MKNSTPTDFDDSERTTAVNFTRSATHTPPPPQQSHSLWHLSRLEGSDTTQFDETWRDDHPCYGHNPSDVQPFHDLFLRQASVDGGEEKEEEERLKDGKEQRGGGGSHSGVAPPKEYYTNRMLYDLLKPDGMSTPYVYGHFQWPHCDVSDQWLSAGKR